MTDNAKLPTLYQEYIHLSRYSRYRYDLERRETWPETVRRYFDFFEEFIYEETGYKLTTNEIEELFNSVINLEVMPSMRCLMTAGEALKRESVAGYNCSFRMIDSPRAFDEILYILMNGVGVGFSVERQEINKLPNVAEELYPTDTTIIVADSKLGWAKALKELIHLLYSGQVPKWDLSKVRPAGAPLKTFGGRASGPEPLEDLFRFVVSVFQGAAGRKLTSLECHDIVCKIAEIVVVGGVRRCLAEDYSIMTNEGWTKITNIDPNLHKVVIEGKEYNINALIDNGVQQTLNINMSNGTIHNSTAEHKWFVYNHETQQAEWVETGNLANGNYSMLEPK